MTEEPDDVLEIGKNFFLDLKRHLTMEIRE